MDDEIRKRAISQARGEWACDELEIDETPQVLASGTAGGYWVAAWVLVRLPEREGVEVSCCNGKGWLHMNGDGPDGDVQRCDECETLPDDAAAGAAHEKDCNCGMKVRGPDEEEEEPEPDPPPTKDELAWERVDDELDRIRGK